MDKKITLTAEEMQKAREAAKWLSSLIFMQGTMAIGLELGITQFAAVVYRTAHEDADKFYVLGRPLHSHIIRKVRFRVYDSIYGEYREQPLFLAGYVSAENARDERYKSMYPFGANFNMYYLKTKPTTTRPTLEACIFALPESEE